MRYTEDGLTEFWLSNTVNAAVVLKEELWGGPNPQGEVGWALVGGLPLPCCVRLGPPL